MRPSASVIGVIAACAGVALAAASLNMPVKKAAPPKAPKPKDRVAMALDTLETQLQRRFHDRNNISFGYERVVRNGARSHFSPVMDRIQFGRRTQSGLPPGYRKVGKEFEFEAEPGKWIPANQVKPSMHPENDAEKQAIAELHGTQVAIYTAGFFEPKTGAPTRLKGPAYLSAIAPDAPGTATIADVASKGWAASADDTDVSKEGWSYRVVKVRADDESCIKCHSETYRGNERIVQALKLKDPVGVVVIGTKGR